MDDNFDDYFTDNAAEEQPAVHQETEQEREEREIKEATIERRGNSIKLLLALIIVAMVVFLGWWMWQHYFSPYRVSQHKGWIMKVSNEGTLFKTYEGEMISDAYVEDTIVAMHSDFSFSIPTDSLAREAMRWSQDGQRIILTYNEYKGAVLWRGNSRHVVTKIERDSNHVKANPYK
jgi:DNA-binding transcriptional regulator of glucitol operon